jgi:hypothetical protein
LQWTTNATTASWSNAISAAIINGKYTVTNRVTPNGQALYRLKR